MQLVNSPVACSEVLFIQICLLELVFFMNPNVLVFLHTLVHFPREKWKQLVGSIQNRVVMVMDESKCSWNPFVR